MIASRSILAACDHHIENPESESRRVPTTFPQKAGESVYIHPTALSNFIQNYLPLLRFPFVLVSGDSDNTVPTDVKNEALVILGHPLLICWYAQNCVEPSEKLHQIPIGLDFHTMAARNHAWGPKQSPESQMADLSRLRSLKVRKINRCYSNFHFLLNSQDRRDAIAQVPKNLVFYEPQRLLRINTWTNMINFKYVLSPHGNGLDCHRTWEALALGCIPIVRTSPLDPMFSGLPVLIVKDWSFINENLLSSFQPGTTEKLELSYWAKIIRNVVS